MSHIEGRVSGPKLQLHGTDLMQMDDRERRKQLEAVRLRGDHGGGEGPQQGHPSPCIAPWCLGVPSGSQPPTAMFPGWPNYFVYQFVIHVKRPVEALTSHFPQPRSVDLGCKSPSDTRLASSRDGEDSASRGATQ
jgi:hypothetical protein